MKVNYITYVIALAVITPVCMIIDPTTIDSIDRLLIIACLASIWSLERENE